MVKLRAGACAVQRLTAVLHTQSPLISSDWIGDDADITDFVASRTVFDQRIDQCFDLCFDITDEEAPRLRS